MIQWKMRVSIDTPEEKDWWDERLNAPPPQILADKILDREVDDEIEAIEEYLGFELEGQLEDEVMIRETITPFIAEYSTGGDLLLASEGQDNPLMAAKMTASFLEEMGRREVRHLDWSIQEGRAGYGGRFSIAPGLVIDIDPRYSQWVIVENEDIEPYCHTYGPFGTRESALKVMELLWPYDDVPIEDGSAIYGLHEMRVVKLNSAAEAIID